MFSGNKDVDRLILLKLDSDREILNVCSLDKHNKICNEDFFRNRIYQKYPKSIPFKFSTWKKYYLFLIYHIDKMKELNFDFTDGDAGSYYKILNQNNREESLITAIREGYLDLVKHFLKDVVPQKTNDNFYMIYAAQNGHKNIVDYLIERGADNWNGGMAGAIKGNHRDLVNFFIKNGANNWNKGVYVSAMMANTDLLTFFMRKGGTSKAAALDGSAYGGQLELVKIFFEKGARDINSALIFAIKGYEEHTEKSRDVIIYLMSLGADSNLGLIEATREENAKLITYFIRRGATDFINASEVATVMDNKFLSDYLQEMDEGNNKFEEFTREKGLVKPEELLIQAIREYPDKVMISYIVTAFAINVKEGILEARRLGNIDLVNYLEENH
jgi:ankyrin repeat protein